MKNFALSEWNLEQVWTCFLLCGLIFFNDPLFGVLLLNPTGSHLEWPIANIITFSCRTFYLMLLLTFWIANFHGIRESNRDCCCFYSLKYALTVPIWVLGGVCYSFAMITYSTNPEIDPKMINDKILPFLIAEASLVAVYILVLLYHFLRGCIDVCRLSYLNTRLSYASFLSFGIIFM